MIVNAKSMNAYSNGPEILSDFGHVSCVFWKQKSLFDFL
jgi:hypothetical protein